MAIELSPTWSNEMEIDFLKLNPNFTPTWNNKVSELILTGKAKTSEEALEITKLELEEKKAITGKDSKSGVT